MYSSSELHMAYTTFTRDAGWGVGERSTEHRDNGNLVGGDGKQNHYMIWGNLELLITF